ncbi:iron-siderophore ABC transporter substrate-binding protein [Nocardioides mangrovicus]|uniref:Iron-siderophore ABC transporter substrate-binding protein n=1 Tax=Nocardioides mangrovicus TaxID=2478913 RepID=A0A3L8P4E1_9ACTN|nr:iron-siderophore ABC transporter substrate-binding protein [Nocardioides mangrovicus]RLV49944.1 iron-siderophore ABC transporter substrate-binding protein [Nocardioides mangrovicus]
MRLRRSSAAVLAALALAATAACSSGPTDSAAAGPTKSTTAAGGVEKGAFPVTITDSLGSVTIKSEPQRVATVGWADADNALALGVVPVGATKITYGGNANGSTPWFDAALEKMGGTQPTRYADTDGVDFDAIAKLSPDLILATSSGVSKADYAKLSKIAPVVAWKGAAFGTPWQTQTEMVGQALGRPAAAKKLVATAEAEIDAFKEANPALSETSAAMPYFDVKDTSQIGFYTTRDLRPQMLNQLGFSTPSVVEKLSKGSSSFYESISSERASSVDAGVLVSYDDPKGTEKKVLADKLWSQIPAIKSGATVWLADRGDSLSMSLPTPLAMPYFLKTIGPDLAAAAKKAQG